MIRMLDAPTRGFAAFMPPPYAVTTPASSSNGPLGANVRGFPGTKRIPSPRPAAMQDGSLGGPKNQNSDLAPNFFRPSIYWTRLVRRNSYPGANRISTNNAPVPVPFVGRTAAQTQKKPRIGGRTVTAWPRQFIRWPTYRDTAAQ